MIYSVAFCNHLASFSINPISYITGNPYQSCTLIQTTLDIKQTPPKNKIKTTLLTCIMYDQLYKKHANKDSLVSPDDELPTKVYCIYKLNTRFQW